MFKSYKADEDFDEIRLKYVDDLCEDINRISFTEDISFFSENGEIQNYNSENNPFINITLEEIVSIMQGNNDQVIKQVFGAFIGNFSNNIIPYTQDFRESGFIYELTKLINHKSYTIYSLALRILFELASCEEFVDDMTTDGFWEIIKKNLNENQSDDHRKIQLVLLLLQRVIHYSEAVRSYFISNHLLDNLLSLVELDRNSYSGIICKLLQILAMEDFVEDDVEYVYTAYANIFSITFQVHPTKSLQFMLNLSRYDDFYEIMTNNALIKEFIQYLGTCSYDLLNYLLGICINFAQSCPFLFTRVFLRLLYIFRTPNQEKNILIGISTLFTVLIPEYTQFNPEDADTEEFAPYLGGNYKFIPENFEIINDETYNGPEEGSQTIGLMQVSILIDISMVVIREFSLLPSYQAQSLVLSLFEVLRLQNPFIVLTLLSEVSTWRADEESSIEYQDKSLMETLNTALEMENPVINYRCLRCLIDLFDLEEKENGTSGLYDEFSECGGIDTVADLTQSEDEDVREIATYFMHKIAPDDF
ncbi:hypothetical protein TVAG_216070 [Trichomonas vaginalis G3]|uniref:Uncharacterized protein n=1 Tax=Trichomonas vaginalis (strain ATCC PRA-98 / G3) TaxID=412133 RepID=A2ENU1_TRIV3|nr:armadillo (ARM) repeat-containing protein family [Trichomonas vaginalis G3]EAY05631.1 hypothetical protein TVAG_216070 [Trichomonas vaginalis G3]KAI5553871.1 armadillo (ARM) repeat-containing protein family [Trichomonas vaginalis G3]|eukprot:XP_001317854.1 hypothetical protein [Trichomonas vaginalis G3]